MLANIDNLRVVQSARLSLNGQAIPTHQVIYTIGDQGPYNDNFTADQWTPDNVFRAQAARIVKLYQIGVKLPYPPVQTPGLPKQWTIPILPNPTASNGSTAALTPVGSYTYIEP